MIKKVALALFNAEHGDGTSWDCMGSEVHAYWRAHARAAITAMRDPTEAMLAAVVPRPDALIEERTAEGIEGYAERMDAAVAAERMALAGRWRGMIAAILE